MTPRNFIEHNSAHGFLSIGDNNRYFDIPYALEINPREKHTKGHTSAASENRIFAVPEISTGSIPSVSMIML